MGQYMKSAAKLVILSAFTAAALAGCAVYEPGYYPGYDPYP
jgi:hypothetical protein